MIKGFPFGHVWVVLIALFLCLVGCRSVGDGRASGAGELEPETQAERSGSAQLAPGSAAREAADEASSAWTGAQCADPRNSAKTRETLEIDEDSAWIATEDNPQELLDSALEHCQTSGGFWEKGDAEGAIHALATAYSLILRTEKVHDPELFQQKADLRFTISKRIVEVYASRISGTQGSSNEIPLVMNDRVGQALTSFKTEKGSSF